MRYTVTSKKPIGLSSLLSPDESPSCSSREIWLNDDEREQCLSRESSAPGLPSYTSPFSSSFSQGDTPESDLSMSPAAMFLSSFSPSAEPAPAPDAEGEYISGYKLGSVIGVGGFSTIRQASSLQGGTVAIKIVRRSDLSKQPDPARARKRLDHEAAIWSTLSHEHVLPLFSVNQTLFADYFVTLYCPAGCLFDILKRDGRPGLAQDDVGMMFRQVVRGLRYLHEVARVVHGDIKPENVLVDEMGVCKIADFGMARRLDECESENESESETVGSKLRRAHASAFATQSRKSHSKQGPLSTHLSLIRHHGGSRHRNSSPLPSSSTQPSAISNRYQQGSLPYASPELLLPHSSAQYVASPAQDIWALGVMLYVLLTGRLPFADSYEPRLQMKILHGVYELPKDVGRGAECVLRGCLERSVPNRWNIATVDEFAWRIGSSEAGDRMMSSPDVRPSRIPSESRSRSRLRVPLDTAAIDDGESYRSSSRATRSTSRSISSARRSSRSQSRHPHHPYDPHSHGRTPAHPRPTEPTFSALTNAILRTTSSSSSESSSPARDDCAILASPRKSHVERERGRRPKSQWLEQASTSQSRSVSPLEVLLTPRDAVRAERSPVCVDSKTSFDADEFILDKSEGSVSELYEDVSRVDGQEVEGSGDVLLPTARQQLQSILKKDDHRHGRPESMPPAPVPLPLTSWCPSPTLVYSTASTPRPILGKAHAARSRSVDPSANKKMGRGRAPL
ncbi:uncharacterized protein FIBRA_01539 [Fibroporia radiculosa]|uniref:Protein kinase domain-containing protein n=1 Tax=Fibroporia radiculosa TaxID=599839 RepID=J4I8J5_9APHY|nr:uncharacterized protein FIBRA_01539 [Fibroporia radiculosa]CCL99521.1 predicted protein [Fibroporia radiculosa]